MYDASVAFPFGRIGLSECLFIGTQKPDYISTAAWLSQFFSNISEKKGSDTQSKFILGPAFSFLPVVLCTEPLPVSVIMAYMHGLFIETHSVS